MSEKPVINFTRGVPANELFPIEEMMAASQAAIRQVRPDYSAVRPLNRFCPAPRMAGSVAGSAG